MQHIDVTSQIVRHQMLMDLAKQVHDHARDNPQDHEHEYHTEEEIIQLVHHHSSK